MGAEQSSAAAGEAFKAFYASLPDDTHDQIEALCAKDDARLQKAHPLAPAAFPPVPIGITVRLSPGAAGAALATVPRLQRKHYEMIPKVITEMEFWVSFFSHLTSVHARSPSTSSVLQCRRPPQPALLVCMTAPRMHKDRC